MITAQLWAQLLYELVYKHSSLHEHCSSTSTALCNLLATHNNYCTILSRAPRYPCHTISSRAPSRPCQATSSRTPCSSPCSTPSGPAHPSRVPRRRPASRRLAYLPWYPHPSLKNMASMFLEPSIPYTPTKSSEPQTVSRQDKAATKIYMKIVCAKRHTDTIGPSGPSTLTNFAFTYLLRYLATTYKALISHNPYFQA